MTFVGSARGFDGGEFSHSMPTRLEEEVWEEEEEAEEEAGGSSVEP